MDPLSIIASSITIAGTANIALKTIYQTYKAKPELLALLNEVTDVTAILREVELSLQLEQQTDDQDLRLDNLLYETIFEIKAKLEQLTENASKWLRKSTVSGHTDSPHLRWLRIALKVKTFRDDFRALRSRLKVTLPALAIQGSSRIELDLRQIMLFAKDTAASQSLFQDDLKSELIEQRNYLETLSQRVVEQSGNGSSMTELASAGNGNNSFQDTFVQSDTEEVSFNDERVVKAFYHSSSILFDSSQMTAISAVGIRTAQFPRSACQPWCSCACHLESRFRSPQLLDRIMGSLFVGYSGLPGLTKKCDQYSCHLRSQPMTYITYFFPQWFLARTISFVLSTTPLAGPVVSLKVSRTVPGDSAIFTYAKTGDLAKIKSLFEGGLASPHDVHYKSGVNALHIAISHRQFSVCKFLLQANADPFMEDRTSWTAADSAWTKILSGSLDSASETSLRTMFSETECLERREFTVLHKIVLGFVPLDLELELAASSAQINKADSSDRTPLSLAAERSDLKAVTILLKYGADPNIISICHGSPLHFAATAPDPTCIPILLACGADPNSVTNWDQTPLHHVAAYTKDVRHANLLLAAGSDPLARDLDGIDPLGWTAITGNVPVAEALLRKGVDISNRDKSGNSALIQSIRGHHYDIISLLLRHGAHEELRMPGNEQTWHVIATTADIRSLQLLQQVGVAADSIDQRYASKLKDLVQGRSDKSHELVSAFGALISRVEPSRGAQVSDEDVADVWEDAVEIISLV